MTSQENSKSYFNEFLEARFKHIDYVLGEFKEEAKGIRSDMDMLRKEIHQDAKNTRITTIITGITVVMGIGAIMVSVLLTVAQIQTSWLTAFAQILQK